MAALTIQDVARAGLAPSFSAAAAGGDTINNADSNRGKVFLYVVNGNGAASRTVTITTQSTVDGLAVADRTVTVDASTRKMIGPFPSNIYNDSDGLVSISYSDSAADLTVAAIKLEAAS